MVLAWSQDRVGPICRTVEDCAMVFNVLHGVDPKDPSTVMTPFHFDRAIKLSTLKIGCGFGRTEGVRGRAQGAGRRAEGTRGAAPVAAAAGSASSRQAAFDFYVVAKAKEFGFDLATLQPPARGGGAGRAGTAGYDRYDGYDGYGGSGRGRWWRGSSGSRGAGRRVDAAAPGARRAWPISRAGRMAGSSTPSTSSMRSAGVRF
jgi:hypothetical protein